MQAGTVKTCCCDDAAISVQFSLKWYPCARKSPYNYALHPVSQRFPQRCLWNSSSVRLIDDGRLSSFRGRSSRASSFHASLLQAIDGVMSLALWPQEVSQASQHFSSSEKRATCEGALSSWMVVTPCLTVKPHPDWSLVTEPSVYTMRSCVFCFLEWEAWSLTLFCLLAILDSAFPFLYYLLNSFLFSFSLFFKIYLNSI